jgi:lysophospholipase L1-like esterase
MSFIARSTDKALIAAAPVVRRMLWPGKAMRRSQFEQLPLPAGRVLFLGDSLTEHGMWHEWFPELPTLNRGIAGDTVGEVRSRLDSAVHDPVAISLLVGTNDLSGLGASRDVSVIAAEFRELVQELRRRAPDAYLIVNSVMPRKATFADPVRALNHEYVAITRDAEATWLDLWPVLADPSGGLRAQFTGDSLHLNGAGYAAWVEALRPLLPSAVV